MRLSQVHNIVYAINHDTMSKEIEILSSQVFTMNITDIPEDVKKSASAAYEAPLGEDGHSLVSVVNKTAEDDVKLAISNAIMTERVRSEEKNLALVGAASSAVTMLRTLDKWIDEGEWWAAEPTRGGFDQEAVKSAIKGLETAISEMRGDGR